MACQLRLVRLVELDNPVVEPEIENDDLKMNILMQNLLELQSLEFDQNITSKTEERIAELRTKIPEPILGHYDRLGDRGKKGLALVRNQVCTGCHMRVPIAVVVELKRGEDIRLCDSCGRYLYVEDLISEAESGSPAAPEKTATPKKKAAAKKRTAVAHAV